jgi:hypothetical protein
MMRKMSVILATALLLGGCKKTVEGETKSWERKTLRTQELTALYPGFGAPLREQLKQAQAVMDAAKGISDKEAAAKKMAEANDMLGGGFIGILERVDDEKKKLREKLVTASTSAVSGPDRLGVKTVSDDAQRILTSVDALLKQGANDAVGANAVLKRVQGDLESAISNVDRVIDSAKKRAEVKKGVTKDPGGATPGGATKTEVVAKSWKCSYCSASNDPTAKKCTNCGAPHP